MRWQAELMVMVVMRGVDDGDYEYCTERQWAKNGKIQFLSWYHLKNLSCT